MNVIVEEIRSDIRRKVVWAANENLEIAAPPGLGVGAILEEAVARAVSRGPVVVVVTNKIKAHQWAYRLERRGLICGMGDQGRESEEYTYATGPFRGPEVLILTTGRLRSAQRAGGLQMPSPELLLIDHSPVTKGGAVAVALDFFAERSRRVISWCEPNDPVFRPEFVRIVVGLPEISSRLAVFPDVRIETPFDPEGERFRNRVSAALGGARGVDSDATALDLHSLLSRSFDDFRSKPFDPSDNPGVSAPDIAEIGALLEEIEATAREPRLSALLDAVARAVGEGRPCVLVAPKIADAAYLGATLESEGYKVNGSRGLESDTSFDLECLGNGEVLVLGASRFSASLLPERCCVVWWTAPSDTLLGRNLAQAILGREIVLIGFDIKILESVNRLMS
jgi:hypothetical protein